MEEEQQTKIVDEAEIVKSLTPPLARPARPRTIRETAEGMTIQGPDGKPIDPRRLDRATRRNFARQLHRQYKPRQIDPAAVHLANYMHNLRKEEAVRQAGLVAEQEVAYLEALKIRKARWAGPAVVR